MDIPWLPVYTHGRPAGVHRASSQSRSVHIMYRSDTTQQHVHRDASDSFFMSQVMKQLPGDVTRRLTVVTAALCLSAAVWPLREELHTHTHTHTHATRVTSCWSLEKIHQGKYNASNKDLETSWGRGTDMSLTPVPSLFWSKVTRTLFYLRTSHQLLQYHQ